MEFTRVLNAWVGSLPALKLTGPSFHSPTAAKPRTGLNVLALRAILAIHALVGLLAAAFVADLLRLHIVLCKHFCSL